MKKRLLSMMLALVMVLGMSSSAFAVKIQPQAVQAIKDVNVDGYTFEISEEVNPNYVATRTYHKVDSETRMTFDRTETEALLCALGMDMDYISGLSVKDLQRYATAEDITVSVAYSRRNELTGAITPLSPEIAIAESEALNQKIEESYVKGNSPTTASVNAGTTDEKTYTDSYMKVTHTVIHKSGALYTFETEAEWLTMPLFRGYDSIGSCASECAYDPESGNGWYSYNTITVKNSVTSAPVFSGKIQIAKGEMKSASKDKFVGRMATFVLPEDTISGDLDNQIFRKNFKAFFSYNGEVSESDGKVTFNSNGTYTHSTVRLSFSPGATISTSGSSSCIGFGLAATTDKRTAEVLVHYIP